MSSQQQEGGVTRETRGSAGGGGSLRAGAGGAAPGKSGSDAEIQVCGMITILLIFLGAVVVLPWGLVLSNDVSSLDVDADFTFLGRTCGIHHVQVRVV